MTDYPLHILVDMDGVIANWNKRFLELSSELFPHIDFPFAKEFTNWDLTHGLDAEGIAAVYHVMNVSGFYAELEPTPGAAQALNEMLDEGYHVSLCTSPMVTNRTCASDKIFWAEEHIGPGWGKRTIITSDKTVIMGDYLFDDKPEIHGASIPVWEHILFDQPYNRTDNMNRKRITDWANWRDYINV